MATDILFVKNPISTSMGTLFGVVLHGFFGLFSPWIQSLDFIKVSAITAFHFIAFGIFGFNIKNYLNRHKVSPKIEAAIILINDQKKKGLISDAEVRLQYRKLISKVVEDATIKDSTSEAMGSSK